MEIQVHVSEHLSCGCTVHCGQTQLKALSIFVFVFVCHLSVLALSVFVFVFACHLSCGSAVHCGQTQPKALSRGTLLLDHQQIYLH